MNPQDYFYMRYIEDLKLFFDLEAKENGPQGILCGMTLQPVIGPSRRYKCHNINEFILSLYCLNLINYKINKSFRGDFYAWCKNSIAFPNCQECTVYHGGIGGPEDIITYVTKSKSISKSDLLNFDLLLTRAYLRFFLIDYIRDLESKFISTDSTSLISALKKDKDQDCTFFQENWVD
jgi:hypothetical protein